MTWQEMLAKADGFAKKAEEYNHNPEWAKFYVKLAEYWRKRAKRQRMIGDEP